MLEAPYRHMHDTRSDKESGTNRGRLCGLVLPAGSRQSAGLWISGASQLVSSSARARLVSLAWCRRALAMLVAPVRRSRLMARFRRVAISLWAVAGANLAEVFTEGHVADLLRGSSLGTGLCSCLLYTSPSPRAGLLSR